MALDKIGLKNAVKTLLDEMKTKESDASEEFATKLADAIDTYVKSATITVQAGIVLTAGGYPGATTGTGTAIIN
ncbi:MAG: hypothetical protein HYR91_11060 [Flavobacteriia bacterium]|nr:hypothetical protein [Flavobacteriia bacterium]